MHSSSLQRKEEVRLLNLIKNEYIKIFKKKGTIIWIIVAILACFGYQFMMKMYNENESMYMYDSNMTVKGMITDYESMYEGKMTGDDKKEYDYWKLADSLGIEKTTDIRINILSQLVDEYRKNNNTDDLTKLKDELKDADFKKWIGYLADKKYDKTYESKDIKDPVVNIYRYMQENNINSFDDWRVDKLVNLEGKQQTVEQGIVGSDQASYDSAVNDMNVYRYAIDNNIENYISSDISSKNYYEDDNNKYDNFWKGFASSASMMNFVTIMMIVIAGGIVANEFSAGTIKFLLINPVKRGKILISKYLTSFSLSVIFSIGIYLINILIGIILNGISSVGINFIGYSNGKVSQYPGVIYILSLYAVYYVGVFVYMTMAFAVSSLLKSTAAAIGIGCGCMAFGSIGITILAALNQDWGRYLLFANTDLVAISKGEGLFINMSLPFAITMLAIYTVIFMVTAYDGFVRREV